MTSSIKISIPQTFKRRSFLAATAALGAATMGVRAQETKLPLRIIVPLPAGGVADTSVRIFADHWTGLTKQNVTVDNRPGGSFQIAMQAMQTVPADGNTWIHLNAGMCAAQAAFGRYDLTKQLTTLGMGGSTPGAIFVSASSPFQTVKDLMTWIAANPGKLNYGAVLGGMEHLSTANMLRRAGLTGTNVPFKGGPDSMTALAQGEIHLVLSALPLIIPFKGKARVLAVLSEQRSPLTPDAPTYKEAGLDMPGLNYWGAYGVPAATPKATIDALHKNIAEITKMPTLMSKYAAQGMFAHSTTPEVMNKVIADEVKWMQPIATELNLKAG